MTEKTDKPKVRRRAAVPHQSGDRYAIDPIAFAFALILAPVLVAILGFWALLIPVFALVLGGPVYLIVGTPVLLIYLHYRPGCAAGAALLALATMLFGMGGIALSDSLLAPVVDIDGLMALAAFGVFFGPLWAATFGGLYNSWRSDASRRPLPPFPHLKLKGVQPC